MASPEADWTRRLRREAAPEPPAVSLADIDLRVAEGDDSFQVRHARRYIASQGADDGWDGPRPILLLYTTGRRSGRLRRSPVLYFDHDGHRHVIASRGGADVHPAWYLNLTADAAVYVRVGAEVYAAAAEVLDGDDRDRVWAALITDYPMFARYEQRSSRLIPVVRLIPDTQAG